MAAVSQDEIDAMLSGVDDTPKANGKLPEPDVLDLTESMAAPASEPPVFRTVDGQSDVFFGEEAPEPPPALHIDPPPSPPRTSVDSALMSSSTSAAAEAAFRQALHVQATVAGKTAGVRAAIFQAI